MSHKYLLWCAHQHVPFRIPEIQSLQKLFGINIKWIEPMSKDPFFLVEAENEDHVKKLISRSISIRSLLELWAEGSSHAEVYTKLQNLPKGKWDPYSHENVSFSIQVKTFCKKLSKSTQISRIEQMDFLPFKGPINLNNPDNLFQLIEHYGTDPNNVSENPERIFFGRWICDGHRNILNKISLRERKFIGNTSMDPTLSLLMANMAKVGKGDIVLDPFVGSGSLLVAAAHFGGYVMGMDIDYLMLHGKAKPTRINQKNREPDESIFNNLKQYNLQSQYLDVIVNDSSLPLWRTNMTFDSIITDPPYGIREAPSKIGTHKKCTIPSHLAEKHIPSKVGYKLKDIFQDLLNFSAKHLKLGGRLVYWLPVFKLDFSENMIPSHPSLRLISYSEQSLAVHSSRYLITMQKVEASMQDGATVPEATSDFRDKYFQSMLIRPKRPEVSSEDKIKKEKQAG